MTSNIHFGDEITRHGDHTVGEFRHPGPPDPQLAVRELAAAALTMRPELSSSDRKVLDVCLDAINPDADLDAPQAQDALIRLTGLAAIAGLHGTPVLEAIHPLQAPAPV
ncbi:hypothetical protein ACM614_00900 [Streptomyces sp. 12297]|uniref:hypothetical protein n=1 Tax=Streptomyces sp. NBC_00239 TaxID=2903640 RepID=UPI002E2D219C|nr:hypothetical protein [Streptomyces sp. NBC_00239]